MTDLSRQLEKSVNPCQRELYPHKSENLNKNWMNAQTLPEIMSESAKAKHKAYIVGELALLQTAYPTQARNFTKGEIETTCKLWETVFQRVHPQLLHDAIGRFVLEDQKGFFPSPGQIVSYVEGIMGELRGREFMKREEEEIERILREYEESLIQKEEYKIQIQITVILTGRLTHDVALKQIANGTTVCSFALAVQRDFKHKHTGEYGVDYIDCVAWRQSAEFIARYGEKGAMVQVQGPWRWKIGQTSWGINGVGTKYKSFKYIWWGLENQRLTRVQTKARDKIIT